MLFQLILHSKMSLPDSQPLSDQYFGRYCRFSRFKTSLVVPVCFPAVKTCVNNFRRETTIGNNYFSKFLKTPLII